MTDLTLTNFKSFLDAVQSITKEDLEKAKRLLQTTGKAIESIEDIFVNNQGELFELLPDGTLVRVNLYIATKEVDQHSYNLDEINLSELYKYHIYQCTTVSNMFNSGRKHRYKINNRDDGTFHYTFTDYLGSTLKTNVNQKMNICKNCLRKFLHIKLASDNDVNSFKLEKFYNQNNSFFDVDVSSMEKGEDASPNVYSRFWNKISTQMKINRNYTCENCGYIPRIAYDKRYIHTHHVNGDKQNNSEDNLQVLCVKCHSEVDSFHARIKGSINYKNYIAKSNR